MPHFDRELIEVMRDALEEAMAKVPWEYSTSATKAYLAECILKTAAQGQISRNELVAAAADQIQAAITLCPCHRAPSDDCSRFIQQAAALREIARPFIDKFRELRGLSTEQDPTNSVVVGVHDTGRSGTFRSDLRGILRGQVQRHRDEGVDLSIDHRCAWVPAVSSAERASWSHISVHLAQQGARVEGDTLSDAPPRQPGQTCLVSKEFQEDIKENIIGIIIWEFQGRIVEANDAFLRMVGHDREDLVRGRVRWTELTPAEQRERHERSLTELQATGTVHPLEMDLFRKDGSRVPVLVGGALSEGGGCEGLAFVLDLTERKRAEEALRESETKFHDYAETASDWLWEIGPDYKFTLLTKNAFGSDPLDRIGKACWDYALDLETESEKWRLVWETLDSRKSFRDFVYCSASGNGSLIYVKASGKPVFDAHGEFRGYRGTGTDVTAIVRAQRAETALRTAQAELAHVSRLTTMGQLTASIAHEVTQPIASARNNARAALNFLDKQPPELGEVREALSCIVGDTDRAGNIIDRIRDHIKKAPPRKLQIDLNDAILEVIGLAGSAIAGNAVSVQTRLGSELPLVQGDRVQLQQVVLNLVLNAVEAMASVDRETRVLSINTELTGTNDVLVAVRDFGPGVDPENLERVFEAFYTTKPGGVGMGLSICRSIIDAHGGWLWADANEPQGAVFQFTLPSAGERMNPLQIRELREGTVLGAFHHSAC
jgi:PAS domain S-box-containing protein